MIDVTIDYLPRPYQREMHEDDTRFKVIVLHRRAGKTVYAIQQLIKDIWTCKLKKPQGAYIAPLYSQAKRIAWSYLMDFTRPIPGMIFNQSELTATFPGGARIMLLGADSPDNIRGMYFDSVVMDEVAQMSPRVFSEIVRPALADRKGKCTFLGTPMGTNQFYDLYQKAEDTKGWDRYLLKWDDTNILDPEEVEAAKAEMSESEFEQEFECSWTAAIKGAFWAKELSAIESHIKNVPYDPTYPVITACDLGIADSFSIWYIQELAGEIRVIDYDEYTGMGLPDIIKKMDEKGYKYKQHIAPHDIKVRELGSGTSRLETARRLGINYTMAPSMGVQDGINAVRTSIPRMYFDKTKCKHGLEALRQYRTEYNDKRGIFSNAPLHDWCSHAADAMRYFCITKRKSSMAGQQLDYSRINQSMQR